MPLNDAPTINDYITEGREQEKEKDREKGTKRRRKRNVCECTLDIIELYKLCK